MNHFTKQAPVHIVLVEEKPNFTSSLGGLIKRTHFPTIDIGIAAAHIALAAADEGLGTCILGWFDEKKVRSLLGIPAAKKVALIITLGYSQQDRRVKLRKGVGEVVGYNGY
jgi:nitroreductase